MRLTGYGVPSPEVVHGVLQPKFRQIEQQCREWCARPSRQRLRPLVSLLGGMAVLARLCRQPASGKCARRALQRLRGNRAVPDRTMVVQCLVMLDSWAGSSTMDHHWRCSLVPLRDTALGALRLPETDGSGLPGPVLQYLALRDCLAGEHCPVRSTAAACAILLADGQKRPDAPRRFAGDMALALESPLTELGAGMTPDDRPRAALHTLYRELSVLIAVQRLRCLALPVKAVRQAQWLILMHLRHHPGDWPSDSLAVLIRHLLGLQWWLMTEAEGKAVDLSPVMRRTGRFLSAWRQACETGSEAVSWLDRSAREGIREELREELYTVARTLPSGEDRPVSPALCTALARLHLTLHCTGHRLLAWWSDTLQQSFLALLQAGGPAGPLWRQRLLAFRSAVLAGPVNGAVSTPATQQPGDHVCALLESVTDEAWLLTALRRSLAQAIAMPVPGLADGPREGVGEQPVEPRQETVIDQLSGGMVHLPDPAAWFDALQADNGASGRTELIRSVVRELTVLEKGARALGVSRIESLAAVLRSVYRQIGVDEGREDAAIMPDRALLLALRRGHAGLLHRLDQAAAWQTISRPQPVIEYLYRSLEAQQSEQPDNALSLPHRCLSINQRLQALVDTATPASVTGERHTLMRTLLHDQARLLKTMAVPDRNRSGQSV